MDEFYDVFYDQILNIVSLLPLCIGQEYGVELQGSVTKDTHSLDLFITFGKVDGIRKHHSEMIAERSLSQEDYDNFACTLAEELVRLPYSKETVF